MKHLKFNESQEESKTTEDLLAEFKAKNGVRLTSELTHTQIIEFADFVRDYYTRTVEKLSHLKRFDETRLVFTPEEGKDVKGALKKLLSEVKKKSKSKRFMGPNSGNEGFEHGKMAVIELLEQLIKERI